MLWTCLSEGSRLCSGVNAGFRTAWLTLKPLFTCLEGVGEIPSYAPGRRKHRNAFSTTAVFRNG